MLGVVVEGGEGRLVCWGVEYPYSSLLPFIAAPKGVGHSCLLVELGCLAFACVLLWLALCLGCLVLCLVLFLVLVLVGMLS